MACWTFDSGTSLPEVLFLMNISVVIQYFCIQHLILLKHLGIFKLTLTHPEYQEGLKNNHLKYLLTLLWNSGFEEFTQVLKCGKKHMLN